MNMQSYWLGNLKLEEQVFAPGPGASNFRVIEGGRALGKTSLRGGGTRDPEFR